MSKVEHLVVLMLENRSFDHVLGWLDQERPEIDGPSTSASNPVIVGSPLAARYSAKPAADFTENLAFDPPHEFADVTEHIFGTANPHVGQAATMDGFVQRAAREASAVGGGANPGSVMLGFGPGRLPAIHALANEFAVCQRWFSSVPGPTWPNRFFAHCASAGGWLDGKIRLYPMPSVFSRLTQVDRSWNIYFHDVPQAANLADVLKHVPIGRFHAFSRFLADARGGTLPSYSFIEPNYFNTTIGFDSGPANDQHPTAAMQPGDALIAATYRALRSSPQWTKSALLIVWDEHGGFYDHVAPPAAVSPDGATGQFGFRFDRLGVRVPAVVVSPWVAKGTVDNVVYDHASIPATLRALFGFAPLTRRDENAASFDRLFSLDQPRTDTPTSLPSQPVALPSADDLDLGTAVGRRRRAGGRGKAAPPGPNQLQQALIELAESLDVPPPRRPGSEAKSRAAAAAARFKRFAAAKEPAAASARKPPARHRAAVRDKIDLRDRSYEPRVAAAPPGSVAPPRGLPAPLDQGDTSACTGYALATLIDYLTVHAGRGDGRVSPRMIYSMARRYDEFRGSRADTGSSLRGALKGWFRHGVCSYALWNDSIPIDAMPESRPDPAKDWWRDALRRPLGAYYRVDHTSLADMQAALVEAGAIYASAVAHAGWDEGDHAGSRKGIWTIPERPIDKDAGGHAFVIVGYDADGFLLLNSWDKTWGSRGIARLTYADWLANAMDAWVVQLGVPTHDRTAASTRKSLALASKPEGNQVALSSEPLVREHEISDFIVDARNEGQLSATGRFRTRPDDVAFLLGHHLEEFQKQHGLKQDSRADVAIYAHGGLIDEDAAAESAGRWIPALYAAGVFPIFVMWESGVLEVMGDLIKDAINKVAPATGARPGLRDAVDARLERLVAPLGSAVWAKMKRNAAELVQADRGALRRLFDRAAVARPLSPERTRLHLIGHSAGSIVHSELAAWLVGRGFDVQSMTLLAPAIRVDRFDQLVRPHLGAGVRRYRQYSLGDAAERADPTVPVYGKSLLYLVSRALEGEPDVGVLGLERDIPEWLTSAGKRTVEVVVAPGPKSMAQTHAGFDADAATMRSVVAALR